MLYSTATAAVYLNLSVATVKYHLYEAKDLVPDRKLGNRLIFTEENLDDFARRKRGQGRPTKSSPNGAGE